MNPDLPRFLQRVAEDDALVRELAVAPLTPNRIADIAGGHGFHVTAADVEREGLPLGEPEWRAAERRYGNAVTSGRSETFILFLEELPMSKEAIVAFFQKAAQDSALQKKLVEFAVEQGFEFTDDELSEVDLDSVAGGILSGKFGTSKIKMGP